MPSATTQLRIRHAGAGRQQWQQQHRVDGLTVLVLLSLLLMVE
jgi:hypothetical protein